MARAKILVIDDEAAILRYFERLLKSLGYAVVLAAESATGCELARDASVSLIISDLTMDAEVSDVALIRTLRELRPDVPIVVITGYPTPNRMTECEALGISDFLTKPFELSFVSGVLARLLPDHVPPEGKAHA